MATYQAIVATSLAILELLKAARGEEGFEHAEFKLYHAQDFENPMEQGVSLYLYRVSVNGTVRTLPPRTAPDGTRYRASLPLDLHYLLTPWARDVQTQQRLLGFSMRALEDTPILPPVLLNYSKSTADIFRPDEAVEIICDPLPVPDWMNLWDKLKPKLQTSVTYVARMVGIDSDRRLSEYLPVQTRQFDLTGVAT